jgi:hypothetical protein
MTPKKVIIIGAGPAGLTAGYELSRHDVSATIVEADDLVGGLARTVNYKGYLFDIGGHRFFTKWDEVNQLWHEILGDAFLLRGRLSRIHYQKKFFFYPLKPLNALWGLGWIESVRILTSYLRAKVMPYPCEANLEQWISNRFGRRLYEIFLKATPKRCGAYPAARSEPSGALSALRVYRWVPLLRARFLNQKRYVPKAWWNSFIIPNAGREKCGQPWRNACAKSVAR